MKIKVPLLLLAAAFLAVIPARAAGAKPGDDRPPLHVIVTESVTDQLGSAYTDFDRFDLAFQYVAKQRKWPVRIEAERLASNGGEYDPQLSVRLLQVRLDPGNEYVFRGWATLKLKGEKRDFGIVTFRYSGRFNENFEDVYEKGFRGLAGAMGAKIEGLLFPDLPAPGQPKK